MSSKHPYNVQGVTRAVVEVSGSFAPDTADPPTDVRGDGFSVVRTSTGLFTLTLDKVFPVCISAVPGLQLAAADDKHVQIGVVDLAAKTVQIRIMDVGGAAVADIAANANNRINFTLKFKNSGV